MTTRDALTIAREYHRGWTTHDVDAAARLLARDLEVEVPINEYPTRDSFANALASFAPLVRRVDVLAELGDADQAMLLYDMDVERIGTMRVAEHFTVSNGRITRIRQVHDTAAVRAAGFAKNT